MIKIAPSILSADFANLERDIHRISDADYVHVDVMDGVFVPNISIGLPVLQSIRKVTDMFLDVHLMMDNPEKYLDVFAGAGAWGITIHAEIPGDVAGMLRHIRALGLSEGLSVKPGTPAEAIRTLLTYADMVLVMTVEPGFGGQKFQPAMLDKLRELRRMGYTGLLEADGGVSLSNLPDLKEAGLDVAVMGTAMYRSADPAADIRAIRQL